MDLALTGRMMDATEAERAGLVSRIVPLDKLMEETLAAALMTSSLPKSACNAAVEVWLSHSIATCTCVIGVCVRSPSAMTISSSHSPFWRLPVSGATRMWCSVQPGKDGD